MKYEGIVLAERWGSWKLHHCEQHLRCQVKKGCLFEERIVNTRLVRKKIFISTSIAFKLCLDHVWLVFRTLLQLAWCAVAMCCQVELHKASCSAQGCACPTWAAPWSRTEAGLAAARPFAQYELCGSLVWRWCAAWPGSSCSHQKSVSQSAKQRNKEI